jgi:hypothetical protein
MVNTLRMVSKSKFQNMVAAYDAQRIPHILCLKSLKARKHRTDVNLHLIKQHKTREFTIEGTNRKVNPPL